MIKNLKDKSDCLISVALVRPVDTVFTYRIPENWLRELEEGGIVEVPFGSKLLLGFYVGERRSLEEIPEGVPLKKIKTVQRIVHASCVFSPALFALCRWAQDYYCAPLGEVLGAAYPLQLVGATTSSTKKKPPALYAQVASHALNPEQLEAVSVFEACRLKLSSNFSGNLLASSPGNLMGVGLLDGVTGSGKTEVYIELSRRVLAEGGAVLVLVPEIALTSQIHRRMQEALGLEVGLWHSALSKARRSSITQAGLGGALRVLVGARSAVFAPLKGLGLIIVDEEHDGSYKQEQRFRYQARDLAIVRGRLEKAFVVLGSATPSLESVRKKEEGFYAYAKLSQAISKSGKRALELVDLRSEPQVQGAQGLLAVKTVEHMQRVLNLGEQVLVFLNRRGFAAYLLCESCGEVLQCPDCSVSLTLYKKRASLRCHFCHHQRPIPEFCPKCKSYELLGMGAGTEGLEQHLLDQLKGVKVARLDRDEVSSVKRLEASLARFRSGEANLLLGTQMLVKGHDFSGVTLVVVILADSLFRWPDFRAGERALQVLRQVSGRAGRGEKKGLVLLQGYDLEHPVLRVLCGQLTEEEFLASEKSLRKELAYPPYGRLVRLRFEAVSQSTVVARSQKLAQALRLALLAEKQDPPVFVLGPSEAFLERVRRLYRWDLLLKSQSVSNLRWALNFCRRFCFYEKWMPLIDVDPNEI